MKVSVLIPVWNAEKYIKECLDSCLRQTFADFEIVVVDDGSADRSSEIVESYSDDRIQLYTKEHSGVADSLNFGLKYCKGEYVARMDADDVMKPYRLKYQSSVMDTHPGVDILCSNVSNKNEWWSWIDSGFLCLDDLYGRYHPAHSAVMFRREAMQVRYGVSFYSTEFRWEDTELWLRSLSDGVKMYFDKTPVIYYRTHDGQISATAGFKGGYDCVVYKKYEKFRKNY